MTERLKMKLLKDLMLTMIAEIFTKIVVALDKAGGLCRARSSLFV